MYYGFIIAEISHFTFYTGVPLAMVNIKSRRKKSMADQAHIVQIPVQHGDGVWSSSFIMYIRRKQRAVSHGVSLSVLYDHNANI